MAKQQEMRLAELAERSGVPARTIRLYISEGLLPGPLRTGRNAAYGPEHLRRLGEIRALQRRGLTLSQARRALEGAGADPSPAAEAPEGAVWRELDIAPGVRVSVKEGFSPRRLRALRRAIEEFSRLVNAGAQEGSDDDQA